jgi:hypothetical protein
MTEVVQLKTSYTTEQQDVITVLERMLDIAREGKVSSVAIAYVRSDRMSCSHSWSSSSTTPALVGAISGMMLQLQLHSMQRALVNPDQAP